MAQSHIYLLACGLSRLVYRLGARFDVDRVESGSYGVECWKAFFEAVDAGSLAPAILYEGDSSASCDGLENVFVIAIEHPATSALDVVKRSLSQSPRFLQLCAAPMFVEGEAATAEPLVLAGRLGPDGALIGDAWNARPGLEAARLQRRGP